MARRWNPARSAVKITAELTQSSRRDVGEMVGMSWKGWTQHPNEPKGNRLRRKNHRRMSRATARMNRGKR